MERELWVGVMGSKSVVLRSDHGNQSLDCRGDR